MASLCCFDFLTLCFLLLSSGALKALAFFQAYCFILMFALCCSYSTISRLSLALLFILFFECDVVLFFSWFLLFSEERYFDVAFRVTHFVVRVFPSARTCPKFISCGIYNTPYLGFRDYLFFRLSGSFDKRLLKNSLARCDWWILCDIMWCLYQVT